MDKTAVRNSIERVLAARSLASRAEEAWRQSQKINHQAQDDLKKAIGQLGTDMGDKAVVGVVYKGILYKVEPWNAGPSGFIESPVIDPVDVDEYTGILNPSLPTEQLRLLQDELAKMKMPRVGRMVTLPNVGSEVEVSEMPVPVTKSSLPPEVHTSKKTTFTNKPNTKDAPNG